jgi:hypothetical protein
VRVELLVSLVLAMGVQVLIQQGSALRLVEEVAAVSMELLGKIPLLLVALVVARVAITPPYSPVALEVLAAIMVALTVLRLHHIRLEGVVVAVRLAVTGLQHPKAVLAALAALIA